ncbi:flagellar basal body rod protein FlgF [Pseudoxanthomonas sp.]|uniref:flagellar basal body rod protein FlgF n=1 Tax=Pseudoxanthomonas sp. TaxID=1871049 RepID=UPI00262799E6|nr:flagellar basal body rod protein FlgF [Pseudoxanthomonas sp.]WDS36851.1 MAG: flagellar basal body rod protein FlgF [Pseudoxanthomonas sp.]
MDKAAYVAMTGASASLQAQTSVSHNLANADTPGFKEALANTQAYRIPGNGYPSRVDSVLGDTGFNNRPGSQQVTGNPLDVSLSQDHWLAVQAADGGEGYTRAGNLLLTPNGQLLSAGRPVLDDNGVPMVVPPHESMQIGDDGTISIVPQGQGPETMATIGRLRTVAAGQKQLTRGLDGLMRNASPQTPLPRAQGSVLTTGVMEGSNVDTADALVQMIQLQRQFEMQVKVIKASDDNAQSANTLLRLGS